MSEHWNELQVENRKLPPEGVVVETMNSGGEVHKLKLMGNLWFLPDGSMYVYYVPRRWKEVQP